MGMICDVWSCRIRSGFTLNAGLRRLSMVVNYERVLGNCVCVSTACVRSRIGCGEATIVRRGTRER